MIDPARILLVNSSPCHLKVNWEICDPTLDGSVQSVEG